MAAYAGSVGFVPLPPGPAGHGWNVEPSDTVPLPATTRAIYVGDAGDVAVLLAGVDNSTPSAGVVTFLAVPAGTTLWVSATHVMDTGTDSTNIVALW